MAWRFVDRQGLEGWIGEDLTVDYTGEEAIEEHVERLAREVGADGTGTRDRTQRVVIELYTTGMVRSVERTDETTTDDGSVSVGGQRETGRSAHADGEHTG